MRILVEIDGVLKDRNDGVIATGILMYGPLTAYNQIILMTEMPEAEAKRWLDVNKIVDYDLLIDKSVHLETENLQERQIQVARSRGNIDLFITSNPNLWVYAFEQGIPSLMFGVPEYLRADFRPDAPKKLRSWDKVQEAVEKQNILKTNDARLQRTEGINFE
jgi:hypothetical protein